MRGATCDAIQRTEGTVNMPWKKTKTVITVTAYSLQETKNKPR